MSAADGQKPVNLSELNSLFGAFAAFPTLVLAVSGGPDSTALLVLAARWRKLLKQPPKLVAVTIDHALRPESKREAAAVKRLARSLGVEHRILRWTGRKPKTGLQEAARIARYRLLAEVANKVRARHVLTAHTLDDQAETVLFRLARGSGVSGLAGMGFIAPVPVREGSALLLGRPLLKVPKSRLIATLNSAKISYADDPTNCDPRFARPRFRALMPALAREGLTTERLARLAGRVERVEDAVFHALKDAQTRIAPEPWPDAGPVTMGAQAVAGLPPEIRLRLLGRAIDRTGSEGPVELGKLEALAAALSEFLFAAPLNSGLARFRRTLAGALITLDAGQLRIERAPPRRRPASKPP